MFLSSTSDVSSLIVDENEGEGTMDVSPRSLRVRAFSSSDSDILHVKKRNKIELPRPNLEAFNSSEFDPLNKLEDRRGAAERRRDAVPVCPPTPQRTPAWVVGHHRRRALSDQQDYYGSPSSSNGRSQRPSRTRTTTKKAIAGSRRGTPSSPAMYSFMNSNSGTTSPSVTNSPSVSKLRFGSSPSATVRTRSSGVSTRSSSKSRAYPKRSHHQSHLRPHPLARKSSLHSTKILLELPGAANDSPISTGGNAAGAVRFADEFTNMGRIGSGNFSEVFCVKSKGDGKTYAVKKSKRIFLSKRDRAVWMKEVENFQRLGPKCEHIIQYYRAWQEEGHFYVQMELCERGNLEDFLVALFGQGDAVPERTVWSWASHLLSALHHVHDARVVHLDVKPQNIFLTQSGQLKIGDFGLAQELASDGDGDSGSTSAGTRDAGDDAGDDASVATVPTSSFDGIEGDSRYMAPELLNASKVTTVVDVFSLGIMLYQITSQFTSLPLHGKRWTDLRENKIPPIRREIYSSALETLIRRMMEANPSKRPTSSSILRDEEKIVEALKAEDDFVVTTPIKVSSSSLSMILGKHDASRFRCESASSGEFAFVGGQYGSDSMDGFPMRRVGSGEFDVHTPRAGEPSTRSFFRNLGTPGPGRTRTPTTVMARSSSTLRSFPSTASSVTSEMTTPRTEHVSRRSSRREDEAADEDMDVDGASERPSPIVTNLFGM